METATSLVRSTKAVVVAGDPVLIAGVLLGTSLLGVVTFIWAFKSYGNSLVMSFSGSQGSVIGIRTLRGRLASLLVTDFLNVITALIFGIMLVSNACSNEYVCLYSFIVWFLTRWLGVINHLLNALLALLYLNDPQQGAYLRWIFTAVSLFIVVFIFVYIFATQVGIFMLAACIFGLVLAIIAIYLRSSVSPSTASQKKTIVLVAMTTFLVTYFPNFVLQCLVISSFNSGQPIFQYEVIYTYVLIFTNFHLVLDGVMFSLILKLSPAEGQQQQPQGVSNPGFQFHNAQWQQQQQQWQQQGVQNQGFQFPTTANK